MYQSLDRKKNSILDQNSRTKNIFNPSIIIYGFESSLEEKLIKVIKII